MMRRTAALALLLVSALCTAHGESVNKNLQTELVVLNTGNQRATLTATASGLTYRLYNKPAVVSHRTWTLTVEEIRQVFLQDKVRAYNSRPTLGEFDMGRAIGWFYSKSLFADSYVLAKYAFSDILRAANRLYRAETANTYGLNEWMRGLRGDLALHQLVIPGTHGSGAFNDVDPPTLSAGATQLWSVAKQLQEGVRFLDIRLADGGATGEYTVMSGQLGFGNFETTVWDPVLQFLVDNPFETVVMSVKREEPFPFNSAAFASKYLSHALCLRSNGLSELGVDIPLDVMRGRVVFVRRTGFATEDLGIDWGSEAVLEQEELLPVRELFASLCTTDTPVRVHIDLCYDFDMKGYYITRHFRKANKLGTNLFINFASAEDPVGFHIDSNAEHQNPLVGSFLKDDVLQAGSIVPMDYVQAFVNVTTALVDANNWLTIHRGFSGEWGQHFYFDREVHICAVGVRVYASSHACDSSTTICPRNDVITGLKLSFCDVNGFVVVSDQVIASGEWGAWLPTVSTGPLLGASVQYNAEENGDVIMTGLQVLQSNGNLKSLWSSTESKSSFDNVVLLPYKNTDRFYLCGARARGAVNGLQFRVCEWASLPSVPSPPLPYTPIPHST